MWADVIIGSQSDFRLEIVSDAVDCEGVIQTMDPSLIRRRIGAVGNTVVENVQNVALLRLLLT